MSKMADHFGEIFSSPSKRLKLNMNSYAVAYSDSSNDVRVMEASDSGETTSDEITYIRKRDRPLSTSPGSSDSNDCSFAADETNFTTATPGLCLGVTSSSDHLLGGEMHEGCLSNGGDSGFNDFTPPSSTDDLETSGTDLDEPDSSTTYRLSETDEDINEAAITINMDDNHHDDDDDIDNDSDDDDNDDDDVASTISYLSGLGDLSDVSGQDWKPAGPMSWVQRQMISGISPRTILQRILPHTAKIPDEVDDLSLWKLIISIVNEPPRRKKLQHINTFDDVLNLIRSSSKIMVLTGAGVSVSCGIPDFRSRDGIYARLSKDFPDLPDPQAMFDIQYFRRDPRPFYKFAKEIYPGLFQPSACHQFIKLLEDKGKLLRNYTQNIDTLEKVAGIQRVIECHGSFATASCLKCKYKVDSTAIRDDIFNQTIPCCTVCPSGRDELSIMKPDIVFFGEGLSDEFHYAMNVDKDQCDLLIVIGSSLKVRPVALIPSSVPGSVPQILINRERLPHMNFDVELLGDCDVIINEICNRLGNGWNHLCYSNVSLTEITSLPESTSRATIDSFAVPDVSSEHSNDPCDSTSYPHRNSKHKDDNYAVRSCHKSPSLLSDDELSVTMQSVCNPDSTELGNDVYRISSSDSNVDASPSSTPTLMECSNDSMRHQAMTERPLLNRPKSLSTLLPDDSFLFCSQNRYIFRGAEVYDVGGDTDSDGENSQDSDDSSSSETSLDDNADDAVLLFDTDDDDDNDDDKSLSKPSTGESLLCADRLHVQAVEPIENILADEVND